MFELFTYVMEFYHLCCNRSQPNFCQQQLYCRYCHYGVSLNTQISSNIEGNIITVLLALVNQQAAIITADIPALTLAPIEPSNIPTPELLDQFKNIKITSEMIEGINKTLNAQ